MFLLFSITDVQLLIKHDVAHTTNVVHKLNFQFCRCCFFSLNGGAPGEKVCNQQSTYCSHGGARELRDQPSAITLQYERKGNVDVNLRFKYQLYGKKY